VERFFADDSVLAALPSVRNRLLVFAGTQDRLVPVRNAAVIAGPVPGSWSLRFAREGHGLPFSSPRAVI
jgi:pimeloyl-ACP methyl ester carboxylesterase